jgi:hypothetical protein
MTIKAQHQELAEKPQIWQGKSDQHSDSNSVLNAFKRGQFNGHFRYFLMGTNNEKQLTDYYANAAGGGLRFETAPFLGFQFAVSGFYIFNIKSSDLSKPDSSTGPMNRYELGLFDIENPSNTKDIDRLEELYIRYKFGKSKVIFGKQLINTPFINLQDGRMRPTGVEGLYTEINASKRTVLEGALLYAISPRSTTRWYYIGESMGLNSQGLNVDGSKSNYFNHIRSDYIALLGLKHTVNSHVKFQLWNQYTDRIFNSSFEQVDFNFSIKRKHNFTLAFQGVQQFAVQDGGNSDPKMTYSAKGSKAFTFGAKFAYQRMNTDWSLNYNRITAHGRYLMPREWGRDPFFTFMARERNEGLGDVHAITAKYQNTIPTSTLKFNLAAGYYKLPDVKQTAFNKYGLPSYFQINADIRYQFSGFLKGLESQLLVASKFLQGETYRNPKYIINKVNLQNYNLVLNYYF